MFATAVLYPVEFKARFRVLLLLNPLTLIEAYRSVLLARRPARRVTVLCWLRSSQCFAFAWLLFHRTEFQFAENV